MDKPVGSYLVRVSERVWGYTLSYKEGDGRFKHFLIDASDLGYQFFGADQTVHESLADLVKFHQVNFHWLHSVCKTVCKLKILLYSSLILFLPGKELFNKNFLLSFKNPINSFQDRSGSLGRQGMGSRAKGCQPNLTISNKNR